MNQIFIQDITTENDILNTVQTKSKMNNINNNFGCS